MNTKMSLPLLIATCALCGCVAEPVEVPMAQQRQPADTNVYFYPSQGRSASVEQQDRDKYECNNWAVQQTGFDPSAPAVPPHQRMQIVDQAPPNGAIVGNAAVAGAALGAVVSNPWHAGRGAVVGGLAGAAVGGLVAAEHDEQLNRLKAHADLSEAQTAVMETQASEFRRALSACLDARGYSVR